MKKIRTVKKWTFNACKAEALKYNKKYDWVKGRGYYAAHRNGWVNECCTHMTESRRPNGNWDFWGCMTDALLYKTKIEWKTNSTAYYTAYNNNWMEYCSAHMIEGRKPANYWTLRTCKADALKYRTKMEWKTNSSGAYSISKKHGWFNECVKHMKGTWTLETCKADAAKYQTIWEWSLKSCASYKYAIRRGWVDECFKEKYRTKKSFIWTLEACKADVEKYKTRGKWSRSTGYYYARKNGWLDECIPLILNKNK